ncbi:hypothetical protein FRC19_005325 [Serendipita sp. 401]|nr:hypothetical protein FRC19_005325 [Serendipita sp. 401]
MLSAGAETLLRMVGWTFLPDLGTRILLNTYRNLQVTLPPRLGMKPSHPPPINTPAYRIQQRISFSIVILIYLVYTSAQAYLQAPPNFYQSLSVSPGVDEGTLKAAFRAFARFNHPDKVGPSGEARFIEARNAFDTLKDSTKRFAYDRFGPDVLSWASECTTMGDYIERGLMASCGFYIVTAVAMVLYAIFGQSGFGAFWRYNLFFTVAALELLLILSPEIPLLHYLFPSRVAYQHIGFLHQFFIYMSIAITRIGPAILPSFTGLGPTQGEWEQERNTLYVVVKQVTEIAAQIDREISRMIYRELKAAHGEVDDPVANGVAPEMDANDTPANAKTGALPGSGDPSTSSLPGSSPNLRQRRVVGSNSRTTTSGPSAPIAGLGGLELNDGVMRKLSKEVEDVVIEKNLKRHPLLARIWREGVLAGRAAYERERESQFFDDRQVKKPTSRSETTAVDPSQPTFSPRQTQKATDDWKRDYVQRRARSEDYYLPTPSHFSSRFSRIEEGLRTTPPPVPIRNIAGMSTSSEADYTASSRGSSPSPQPSPRSLAMMRALLERPTLSPGPEFAHHGSGETSGESFPPLIGGDRFTSSQRSLDPPSPGPSGRFDALRNRSMSLIN